ncbi:MAG: hypothetical protein H6704_22845 [Myxococcales bacterium]|nr:hypothetical protein [Myxococcales bacterium]
MKGDIKPGSVLFIIVRKDAGEGQRGMLIAAKRVDVQGPDQFPLTYEVSSADVMMQGTALEGAVRIEARVDQDGDALSKTPGDVTGDGPATTVGGAAADFTLDTRI